MIPLIPYTKSLGITVLSTPEVAGLMTQQEAEHSEIQNIILRALGSEEKVEPDLQDVICQPNDVLLLASDGLTKLVRIEGANLDRVKRSNIKAK